LNDPARRSLLERLSALILREPGDREQLTQLLRSAYSRNLLDADAMSIIEGALTVSEMQVRDIMIPRAQMDVIDINEPVENFIPQVVSTAHSRFPVIDQNRDDVIGILLAKDLLRYYAGKEGFNVREMLRPAVFVPEAKRLNVLLREFRASRNHMAIVLDEYGGVAGLVTIEDVLEQIVGDIEDEYDFDEASDNILPEPGGRYRVKALTQIADFNAAFGARFAFGLGLFGGGVSWVYVSLSQFGGMPAPLAGLATFLFCAFIALFPAAAGWLQARVPAADGARACLVIPAAWTLFEWLRGWILTGFPWLSAGYAATGWPTQGYAPLLGMYGLSFITLGAAGMLWGLVTKKKIRFLVLLVAVAGIGQALRAVDWTVPAGDPVRAALLQGNIEQEMKFRPERYARILETYARLAEETSARLIILPETAVPRFYDGVEPEYLARLDAAAKRNGGDLLLGVPYREAQDRYYNSVVTLGTAPRQVYHKVHLVPFGEFVPPGFS